MGNCIVSKVYFSTFLIVHKGIKVLWLILFCCSEEPTESNAWVSLFQNNNWSSKYNDILAQHAKWYYRLNANKIKLMNRNWQGDDFSKFIKGKHGFYRGEKLQKIKISFVAKKITYIGPEYSKRCKKNNIFFWGGGMFPEKSWFCQYFFLDYNGAPL